MIWRKTFFLGLVSTLLAFIACLVYLNVYTGAFYVDFSKVVGVINLLVASAIGCFLMATGYQIVINWKGSKFVGILNIIYSVISFASIAGVLGFNLPLEIESPEMFPGLVIPMHFFPVLSFLTIYPFFSNLNDNKNELS
jgi:hypothetical protein